jgi:carbonic anhydrase/acetyltransferase-like protein (isoleucine patch superfamily)
MSFRKLTEEEINFLKLRSCTAENWDTIEVHSDFNPENISHVSFSGKIKIGRLNSVFTFPGGMEKPAGLHNASLHNCELEDNVLIENIQNYIANYKIGSGTIIQNVNSIYVDEKSSFGNGIEVSVVNETGGREVKIYDKLSAPVAYILAFFRNHPVSLSKLNEWIDCYAQQQASETGTIGTNVRINNAGVLRNVRIGSHTTVDGTSRLENGSVNSNEHDPVFIGEGVIAEHFIICSGVKIKEGVALTRSFVGQASCLGHAYSVNNSLFFSNCHGENGEACAVFAGPYTVTHHKSTLLIGGMFSFFNAGSGTNQSNHLYKLGPMHEGFVERGGRTASNAYILWPARVGVFSLIMGRHLHHPDTSDLPFSYLIEDKGKTLVFPGYSLKSVGTIRDAKKFPERDRRKDVALLDPINFNLLNPYTVQKIFKAIEILKSLKQTSDALPVTSYSYKNCQINNSTLEKGLDIYDKTIKKFLGDWLIARLGYPFPSFEEIRKSLNSISDPASDEWMDLSGMILPKRMIDELLHSIESDKISCLNDFTTSINEAHANYDSFAGEWTWSKIQSYYHLLPETLRADDIIRIIEDWKEAVVSLDKLLYEDAQKEFLLSLQINFNIEANKDKSDPDFEQVREIFEQNAFVSSILQDIK